MFINRIRLPIMDAIDVALSTFICMIQLAINIRITIFRFLTWMLLNAPHPHRTSSIIHKTSS